VVEIHYLVAEYGVSLGVGAEVDPVATVRRQDVVRNVVVVAAYDADSLVGVARYRVIDEPVTVGSFEGDAPFMVVPNVIPVDVIGVRSQE
jgi:type 1 fimbria pilin